MPHGLTPSEKFVASLCERSFLKLWTHSNPKGKRGKELCDCLVVCGPHIVIVSVKDIEYKDTGDRTGWDRWAKAAIEKSASQIWGAERWLETVSAVVRHDGRVLTLPPKSERQYHRVAVSLGGRGPVPLKWGNLRNGFVHVCDEYSLGVIFDALDTITDFVEFLSASEALIRNKVRLIFTGGGIEDLVALYLSNGRSFDITPGSDERPTMLILEDDLWKGFSESEEYRAMQNDLSNSYIWDRLIEHYAEDLLTDGMFDMYSKQVTHNDLALETMALQPRGHRAVLAEAFKEFLENPELRIASRVVQGYGKTAFVFLARSSAYRELKAQELERRCLVVRGRLPNVTTVVGIGTDRPGTSKIGYSSDILYMDIPEWTPENEEIVSGIQAEFGYFQNVQWSKH